MLELAAWAWAQQPKAPGQVWRNQYGWTVVLVRRDEDVYPGWWCKGGWFALDKPEKGQIRLVSRVR